MIIIAIDESICASMSESITSLTIFFPFFVINFDHVLLATCIAFVHMLHTLKLNIKNWKIKYAIC
jgi:hypothetical protein